MNSLNNLFLVIPIVCVILFIVLPLMMRGKKESGSADKIILPYEKQKCILTDYELNFYKKLKPIIDKNNYIILIKPRLADIVKVKKGTDKYQSWFNRISAKHIDFLICSPVNLETVLGIELDDKSHERDDRKNRDIFVDEVFAVSGISILHITKQYDSQSLENEIVSCLQKT